MTKQNVIIQLTFAYPVKNLNETCGLGKGLPVILGKKKKKGYYRHQEMSRDRISILSP